MPSIITVICLISSLAFPTLMVCLSYPVNNKLALFWSNYITKKVCHHFFAILKTYRHFNYLSDGQSKKKVPEKFLIISNHQSLLDIVVYFKFFTEKEVRFVAKDTLNKVPMVGKMLRSQNHCMIPRKGGMTTAMHALEKFGRQVNANKNEIPVIFPEGTRSKDGNLGTFYSAGFRRLEETVNLPVVVCALDGGWKISNLDEIMRNLYKGSYRVKVLKVFDPPKTKEEQLAILDESKQLIQKQLDEWRALPKDSLKV